MKQAISQWRCRENNMRGGELIGSMDAWVHRECAVLSSTETYNTVYIYVYL